MGGGPFVLPSIPLLLAAGTDEPILTFLNPPNLLMLPTVQETLTLAPRTLCCLTWPLPSSKDLLVFINFFHGFFTLPQERKSLSQLSPSLPRCSDLLPCQLPQALALLIMCLSCVPSLVSTGISPFPLVGKAANS